MLIGMIKKQKTGAFYWGKKANKVFNMLKELFITALILRMFDLLFRTKLKTNVSGFALKTIISQFFHDPIYRRDDWHPITF
jgi:hypothetical protein